MAEATLSAPVASASLHHTAGCLWQDHQCRTHEVRQAPALGAEGLCRRQRGSVWEEPTYLCARNEVCVDVCARVHAFFFLFVMGTVEFGAFFYKKQPSLPQYNFQPGKNLTKTAGVA